MDRRSPEAAEYRRLYNLAAWKRARTLQLSEKPLCERCEAAGFRIPARIVNHRVPHKGDMALFMDPSNHQSLCAPCHDGPVQSEERGGKPREIGFSPEVDVDGWPCDPRHPANRRT